MDDTRRCTAKAKQTGKRCKRAAILGGTVCKIHGGGAPAVKNAAKQRLLDAADPAAKRLVELLDSDDERIRLGAIRDLLDRAGLKPPTEIKGEVTIESAVAVVEEEIKARKRRLDGVDD